MLHYHKPSMSHVLGAYSLRLKNDAVLKSVASQQPSPFGPYIHITKIGRALARRVRCVGNTITSLHAALGFNIWQKDVFLLYRRCTRQARVIVRYDGHNYDRLISLLLQQDSSLVRRRPASSLRVGRLYFVDTDCRITVMSPSYHMFCLSHYNYVFTGKQFHSVCLTYGIARYLANLYPEVEFVCTLNYNRWVVRHRYYHFKELCRVPINSQRRTMKVWMAVDPDGHLQHFDPTTLPPSLIEEYMQMPDFYEEFKVLTDAYGLKGLYAYNRYHLLPCIYVDIRLRNNYAHVCDVTGKWAMYSLCEERFITPFLYEPICYDTVRGIIYGVADDCNVVFYRYSYAKMKQEVFARRKTS